MYGLAVEHTLHDLVQWSGQAGETYFFQAELPYDATQAFGDAGYVAYRVTDSVLSHKAFGVGVYHYFRDNQVLVRSAIAAPAWLDTSTTVLTTPGAGKVLMDRHPPSQRHSPGQDKQHLPPRTEPSFAIPWWAWLSLVLQTSAICGLGVFLWHLSAVARNCLNNENHVEPQPGEEAMGTPPRIEGSSSRMVLVHPPPPTTTITTVMAYSPETTRSMRSFMVVSPVSADEA